MKQWHKPEDCYPEAGEDCVVLLADNTYRIARYDCREQIWVEMRTNLILLPDTEEVEYWHYIFPPGWFGEK